MDCKHRLCVNCTSYFCKGLRRESEYDLAEQLYRMVLARVNVEYRTSVYSLLANLYVEKGALEPARHMLSETVRGVDWLSPSSQMMQHLMAIAKGLIALDRPNAARSFTDYILQSPLTRSIHRQMVTEMADTLPTTPSTEPHTLTQLREIAEREILGT